MADQRIVPAGATIEFPYHLKPDGTPYQVQVAEDATMEQIQAFANDNFPRNALAVARQMAAPGAPPVLEEEYNDIKALGEANDAIQKDRQGGPSIWAMLGDVGKQVAKDVVGGAIEAGNQLTGSKEYLMAGRYEEALKKSVFGLAALTEGISRGNQNLVELAKLASSFVYTGEPASASGYNTYLQLKENEANQQFREQSGQTIFGQDKQLADSANKISNFLDATMILPFVGKALGGLTQAGKEVAVDSIKQMAKESSASFLRQAAGDIAAGVGEKVATAGDILNTGLKKGLAATGAVGVGAGAAYAFQEPNTAIGLGLLAAGIPFASVAGRMLQGAGKSLALDSATLAGREMLEKAGASAANDVAVRLAMAVKPPDSAVRFVGSAIDSVLNGGAIGAGMSYIQAAADPFATGESIMQKTILGAEGGMAAGLTFHGMFGAGMGEFSKSARDQNYARNIASDILSRPEERSVVIDGKEINSNDRQNRISLLIESSLPMADKARVSSVLRSAEAAGHDVVFVNDATPLPESLGGSGEAMGKGVSVRIGKDGRSTILINSDRITAPSAVEEVTHAMISDQMAREVFAGMSKQAGGIRQALNNLMPFAERYFSTQAQTNPVAAEAFAQSLRVANDPNMPEDVRINAVLPLVHEYLGMSAGEILKGKAPSELETGLAGNIWHKAAETVLSGLNMTPSGATNDPITGFFWKDGKIIKDEVLEKTTNNLQAAVRTGKNLTGEQKPSKQRMYRQVAPEPHPSGYEPGDITLDGSKVAGFNVGPRYEDQVLDTKTGRLKPTTGAEKDAIHQFVFDQTSKIKGEQIVEQGMWEDGVYAGPVKPTKMKARMPKNAPETPIVYADSSLSQPELLKLFSITDHLGNTIIKPENRAAVEMANAAIDTGNILNLDVNVNLNKSKESNREYAARLQKKVLALGIQQTKESGVLLQTYDLSLLDNVLNHERQLTPRVDAALKDFNITTLQDAVPYIKAYLENLSNSKSLPSAERLAMMAPQGASPESVVILRDLFHLAGGLTQRKQLSEKLFNEPFKQAITELPPYSVEVGGVTKKLQRDQSVFNWHRVDDINGAALYQPDGVPLAIKVDKANMVKRYRANFSPDTSVRETLGDSTVVTDPQTKERMIIKPNGKVDLFNAVGKRTTYSSEQEAVAASNKELVKSIQAQFSPGGERLTPKERKQVQQYLMYKDIRDGVAFQELRAAHDAILRGRKERVGGTLPPWSEAKEIRTAIQKQTEALMRKRQRFAKQITDESIAYAAENKPPVFDAESFESKTGKKPRSERRKMSQAELEAVTEAANYVAPVGKPAETRPKATVSAGSTLKSFEQLTGLKTFAPEVPTEAKAVPAAAPQVKPVVVDLISEKKKPFRAAPIKTKMFEAFLKELDADKARTYESALNQAISLEPSTYTIPEPKAKVEPPKETKVEGVATAVDDPQIPRTHVIQIMPSGKYKVWSIGRQAVEAVTDTYEDAIKRARKRALEQKPKQKARLVLK